MNRVELPIASPCTVDWTAMTLADRGRFCGSCRKVVRELAQLTEAEARSLLASPPTEGLCVRYLHDATGEIVFRPEVVPASWLHRARRTAATAFAAASIPLAAAGCAASQSSSPVSPMMGAPPPMIGEVRVMAPPSPASSAKPVATSPTDAPPPVKR